jgi:hypothetical protein
MITFRQYYKEQFKDMKIIWKLAKKNKKYFALFCSIFTLFNPWVIHTMYLYDTGLMKVDKRFKEIEK